MLTDAYLEAWPEADTKPGTRKHHHPYLRKPIIVRGTARPNGL